MKIVSANAPADSEELPDGSTSAVDGASKESRGIQRFTKRTKEMRHISF